MVEESREVPKGAVPLSAAIGALRDELMYAVWAAQFAYELDGKQRWLRFTDARLRSIHAASATRRLRR